MMRCCLLRFIDTLLLRVIIDDYHCRHRLITTIYWRTPSVMLFDADIDVFAAICHVARAAADSYGYAVMMPY